MSESHWWQIFKPREKSLGETTVGLTNPNLKGQLSSMTDKIKGSNEKYRKEIEKWKKVSSLNKSLTESYLTNMNVMIDVSGLLNEYVHFLEVLNQEITKMDTQFQSLTKDDIGHIQALTNDTIKNFTSQFMTETDKIKKLYDTIGLSNSKEKLDLEKAQTALGATMQVAKSITENAALKNVKGGKGRRPRSDGKKRTKKTISKTKK